MSGDGGQADERIRQTEELIRRLEGKPPKGDGDAMFIPPEVALASQRVIFGRVKRS